MLDFILIAITILTWNTCRMGEFKKPDQNGVLQYLVSQDADIICLQEVDVYKSDRYLTLPEVKQILRAKYAYSYLDFSIYDKRHQFGTMVWSKYPLIHKHSIHYESLGNLSNRCDVVVGKDTFRLFNNHLESYSFTPSDLKEIERVEEKVKRAAPLRNEQARVVRKEIEESPYPVIVVGDFNSIPFSYTYWHISRGLRDAWWSTHSIWEWGATYDYNGFGVRIDYILTSPFFTPVSCFVSPASGSDHKPLIATLEW